MIYFKSVTPKNFMSVGDNEITIPLNENDSTLITGDNGSGKSVLIVDAIFFALFGKSFRGLNKTDMINTINKKNCVVTLVFEAKGAEYTIRRGLKPNVFEVLENGENQFEEFSVAQLQSHVESDIIGFDEKAFRQTQVISTTDFKPFMKLSKPERRQLIEQLLDINIFADMKRNLHERMKTVKGDIESDEQEAESQRRLIATSKNFVDQLEQQAQSNLDEKREERKRVSDELEKTESELDEAVEKSDAFLASDEYKNSEFAAEELENDKKSIRDIERRIAKLEQRVSDADKRLRWFKQHDHCPTCKQSLEGSDIASEIPAIEVERDGHNADIDDLKNELSETQERVKNFEQTLEDIRSSEDHYQSEVQSLVGDRKRLRAQIERLDEAIDKGQSDNSETISEEREKIKNLESEAAKLETQASRNRKKYTVMQKAYKMLDDDGVKSIIIDNYIPVLNTSVNQYLDAMNFNISFVIDREFKETVQSRLRKDMGYLNFSMGQRHRIDLAMILAWRRVAQMKNSIVTNLLIFDETFDSSIDGSGTDDLKAIIESEQSRMRDSNGKTLLNVFVISHRGAMREIFDHNIDFELKKGFTHIRENV